MVNFSKLDLLCIICKNVLKDPVYLPCHCTICHAHLKLAKDGLIACETCGDEFVVNNIECKVNKIAKKALDAELHLSFEEKGLKKDIHELMLSLQQLHEQLNQEQNKFELKSHENFAEIKRKIDIQREKLKEKIDEISLAMIRKVEEHEAFYKLKLDDSRRIKAFNLNMEKESLDDVFRQMDLKIERVQQLKTENEANIKDLQSRLEFLKSISQQTEKCCFVSNTDFGVASFGALNLRSLTNFLVSCSRDNSIKMWDIETRECIRTLEGHSDEIKCIDVLENGFLISSSYDKSLKIWNPSDGACLKTIDVSGSIYCMQVLSGDRVACGSGAEITIWNLNDGTCIQTLKGHTQYIQCLMVLPDETIVSGSKDNTIKFWNLSENTCINTLNGHTDWVFCLLLLKDGHLASGSEDTTIKIWKRENGECIKTLQGHTDCVRALESTDTFDLISCSDDKSIIIWNVNSGECIRTLLCHNEAARRIRIYSNDMLASGSLDNSIQLWDLASGQCTHTLDGHQDWINGLCFI